MAVVKASLFFRKNRTYSVGSINFDLILSENHIFNSAITEYSVEEGEPISDHIENDLENGSLTGLITNFSINYGAITENRSQRVFDALYDLWKKKELVTIVTVLKVYEDVGITNISIDKSESDGESLIVNISFRKVNVVKLQEVLVQATVNLTDMGDDLNKQSSPNLDVGRTTPVVG